MRDLHLEHVVSQHNFLILEKLQSTTSDLSSLNICFLEFKRDRVQYFCLPSQAKYPGDLRGEIYGDDPQPSAAAPHIRMLVKSATPLIAFFGSSKFVIFPLA